MTNGRDPERLQQRVAQLEAALRRERDLLASVRQRHEHELATAHRRTSSKGTGGADKKIARLERKLAQVYASRTWKAGRAVWHVFHLPRAIAGWFRRAAPTSPVSPSPEPPRPSAPPIEAIDYTLVENHVVRDKYQAAVAKLAFSGGAGRNIAIAVYTADLDAGRGDLYTAVGLGRQLEPMGCEVIYLARDRWYEVPRGTDVYIAMLETVDLTQLPADLTTIAWVRNQTESWVEQPSLGLYDMVLASSTRSLEAIGRHYAGPTGLLRLGVDSELFDLAGRPEDRRGVVSTINQWGREREVNAYLRSRPVEFPLAIYGRQRGIAPELAAYCRGPVSFFALPSLYNEAKVVLDDFNHTTAGYGNINSRLFEAVACGAIVMTSRSTGLDAVGLDDIPVFTTAPELHELVTGQLEDPGALKAAEARANRVRERHSYAKRAAELLAHLDQFGAGTDRRRDGLVIAHFPDYQDSPFTAMMWSTLRAEGAIAVPVANTLDFTAAVRAADHRSAVFHLNWTAPILGPSRDPAVRSRRHRRFLEGLDELHDRGVPLVWTVHNVLPHECADPRLEVQLRQEIADRVDLIHVMCEHTPDACAGYYELPAEKVRVLPHPGFIDVYPNLVDRATARDELGLAADDFVYLHFGKVRPYKGVDALLDAFDRISRRDRSARLLLIGEPGRFEQRDEIIQQARANPAVLSNFSAVPDEDIQLYMNAADVVVLPYRKVLNSGALQLAYSFAKPVVAAAIGCIPHQVDETTGILFDWVNGEHALQIAMQAARGLGPEHGQAAYERAAANHYLDIGRRFQEYVAGAVASRRL